jgi:prophage maintenance system killer protein
MDDVFLSTDDVIRIHADQITRYGGSLGLRDHGLLEAAVAMPRQPFIDTPIWGRWPLRTCSI